MRASLAVIRDSFREAIVSRVLWVLLVFITVILLALAPFGARQVSFSKLRYWDILDPEQLGKNLYMEFNSEDPSPGKHIWELLDSTTQDQLRKAGEGAAENVGGAAHGVLRLFEELNDLLDRRNFYNEEAWRGVALDPEATELIDRGIPALSHEEIQRLNRLLLEGAYRNLIAKSPRKSVQFSYASLDFMDPYPISDQQLTAAVEQGLVTVMGLVVGVGAVFIGILVTAPVIPHMFETGSIELLLSKPITRVMLFLTKYFGGCMFVMVSGAYLIAGIWLIAGVRFGVWESRLFLCVPIFLFLFMVYYSVSALAALIWRSAIVCVAVSIIFWLVCFSLSLTKQIIQNTSVIPSQLVRVVMADDRWVAVNESGQVRQWNEQSEEWRETFSRPNPIAVISPFAIHQRQMIGPVYNPKTEQLIAIELPIHGTWKSASGANLQVGHRYQNWHPRAVAVAPAGTLAIFVTKDGECLAVAHEGVFQLSATSLQEERSQDDLLFFDLPEFKLDYKPPDAGDWNPQAAAMHPDTNAIAIWNNSRIDVIAHNDIAERRFAVDDVADSVVLAFAGNTILVADENGQMIAIDATDGEVKARNDAGAIPRFAYASRDGQWFAVLFHSGRLQMFEVSENRFFAPSVGGQGDISAAAFADGKLAVVDRGNRLTRYKLPSLAADQRIEPELENDEWFYRRCILPLYTLFPKQGELDATVHYLLQTNDEPDSDETRSLAAARLPNEPWSPVISSSIFICVMLSICCWYMHRTDF
jgi:ABC-type transport system involved in multi-copper enzyme maturation permease subunit